ncbi:MAG TPA: EamA family transporter RarD [Steroidobacteraceae bacterium]|nr:EamA family transporter RarD [Steroidobacteraceae bacterium]
MTPASKGFVPAATAFAIWGIFPLYFHPLHEVSPGQVIAHRIFWSCVFLLLWLTVRGELGSLRETFTNRAALLRLAASAALITFNWLVYVWGIFHGHVVETSLGYFIGPLVNVLLGTVLLSERLTPTQWTAVALAAAGVGYLTLMAGGFPWIALTLSCSFATYGLIRKVVKVAALPGLATETLLLTPLALAYLLWCESTGAGALRHSSLAIDALLIGSGPITAITLFLFAFGTRLLPYSTVGVLQYIAPTGQFICGVFVLHEPFDHTRAIGFTIIWAALLIYAGEGFRLSRRQQRAFA